MAFTLFEDEEKAMREYEGYMKRLYPREYGGLRVLDWRWVPEERASLFVRLRWFFRAPR